jgi:hypothetical protein
VVTRPGRIVRTTAPASHAINIIGDMDTDSQQRDPDGASHDGLAAVAVVVLAGLLIAYLVSQIV